MPGSAQPSRGKPPDGSSRSCSAKHDDAGSCRPRTPGRRCPAATRRRAAAPYQRSALVRRRRSRAGPRSSTASTNAEQGQRQGHGQALRRSPGRRAAMLTNDVPRSTGRQLAEPVRELLGQRLVGADLAAAPPRSAPAWRRPRAARWPGRPAAAAAARTARPSRPRATTRMASGAADRAASSRGAGGPSTRHGRSISSLLDVVGEELRVQPVDAGSRDSSLAATTICG